MAEVSKKEEYNTVGAHADGAVKCEVGVDGCGGDVRREIRP